MPVDSIEGDFTVGLCFLNDIAYLFRQPNFYLLLLQPVIDFIKRVNFFEECDTQKVTVTEEGSLSSKKKALISSFDSGSNDDEMEKFEVV